MATSTFLEHGRWVPGIGDPTIIGWVTVAVYFIVALICFKAVFLSNIHYRQNKPGSDKSILVFWNFLAFILIFLGFNKQLDLQSLLTQIGRDIAVEQGWYKSRRTVQVIFVISIGLIGVATFTYLIRTYRNTNSSVKIALTGCVILFSFIFIRASSFHHIDIFISMKLAGVRMNGALELGGLAIIGIGGFRYSKSKN